MLAELATAVVGWGLQINPFDQPNVQQAKDATNRVLAGYEQDSTSSPERPDGDIDALRKLLLGGAPPGYVAVMAYTRPTPEFDEALAGLRAAIRAASSMTTTFGYGPRFLHSTGPVPQGRPKDRPLPATAPRRPAGRRYPGPALHLHDAQERSGDRRLRHVAGARPARGSRASGRTRPGGRDPRSDSDIRERELTRSVSSGWARWAATWCTASGATPSTRSSPSTSARRRQAGRRQRRHGRRLARGPRQEARGAADGLDHGARRRADRGDGHQALQAARPGRHDRRRRQLQVDRRQAPRRGTEASRHRLRRRRHLRRRLGPGGRLLHDGRRAAQGRQAPGADPRRARARDQRAQPRGDRAARLAAVRTARAPGTT